MEKHPRHRFPLLLLALFVALSWVATPARAGDADPAAEAEAEVTEETAETPAVASSPIPATFGGLRVVVDPQTGRIVADPPEAARLDFFFSQELLRHMSTSQEGLLQEPAPRDGIMVRLQGRFMSPLVASVGPDGSIQMDHAVLASSASNDDAKETGNDTP